MARINVLPKSVAELIAAGEVVERPSSVVKELMENSVDAGAKSISVEIKNGGIRYIRVTDDGCGIHRDDVKKAFISHATSKITDSSDLDAIFTLGFRGEALPSVAAVSRLQLLTKTKEADAGVSYEIHGGEEIDFSDAGCPDGTTVIIRDLFFNTPARMKFLKKDMTEGTYVSDVVAKTALSHPEIRVSLIKDGKQVLSTPGSGDLMSAIYSVFGKEISSGLIECNSEHDSIKIRGYISKPLNNRPNRNLQYCFVNGRYVRIPVASAALDEAYKNRIMVGKFPMCFLFIDIPPGKTDVNVHPAKTEIRFSEDAKIFEAIFYSAKAALNYGDTARPEAVLKEKRGLLDRSVPDSAQMSFSAQKNEAKINTAEKMTVTGEVFSDIKRDSGTLSEKINKVFSDKENSGGVFRDTSDIFTSAVTKEEARLSNLRLIEEQRRRLEMSRASEKTEFTDTKEQKKTEPVMTDTEKEKSSEPSEMKASLAENISSAASGVRNIPAEEGSVTPSHTAEVSEENKAEAKNTEKESRGPVGEDTFTITGEIFRTYILVECEDRLLIIDKHAAHERMIFNRLMKKGFTEASQLFLSPVSVTLTSKEYAAVLENLEVFSEGGFTVEDFGGSTVIVRECPVSLQKEDIVSVITEMAGELLRGNKKPVPEKLSWLYHSTACRSAVKAGDETKPEEMKALVRELLSDPEIRYCPHGRPVIYELSKREIEKQFGRV